jgi:hypothetical protein
MVLKESILTVKSTVSQTLAPVWQATYGATPVVTWAAAVYTTRNRNWTNGFPNRKSMLQYLLTNGYLPTMPYQDSYSTEPCSKSVTITGLLYSAPNSTFTKSFIPATPRLPVDPMNDAGIATLVAKVISKLQGKVVGHGTNLPVSLMEAKSTIGMIGKTAQKLYTAYRHVRHGNFLAGATALGLDRVPREVSARKAFETNWLEYRYGWRLVVNDIDSLLKTLWDTLKTKPLHYVVTAEEKSETTSITNTPGSIYVNSSEACKWTQQCTTVTSRVVRAGYRYRMTSDAVSTQQSFGILNPFVIAWELIPYSFVVDWVANVGECLQGLNAFAGKSCLDGWINREMHTTRTYLWTGVQKGSGVYRLDAPFPTFKVTGAGERKFNRQKSDFTPATFRLEFPDLGVSKALDLLTLVTQRRF